MTLRKQKDAKKSDIDTTCPCLCQMVRYYSQDVKTCGELVDVACGPISLLNAMAMMGVEVGVPEVLQAARKYLDAGGLSPGALAALAEGIGQPFGIGARALQPCRAEAVVPGSLLFVSAQALVNAQGAVEFESTIPDAHNVIVAVENVESDGTLVVIILIDDELGKGSRWTCGAG